MQIRRFVTGIVLLVATTVSAQQTIYFKKDHVYDGPGGKEIAVIMPAPTDQTAPTTPSLTCSTVTSTSVQVSWSAATDSGGSSLAGYKVYRQRGTGASLPVGTVGTSTLSFLDQPLTASTGYTYTVRAFDNAQNHSAASNAINVTTGGSCSGGGSGYQYSKQITINSGQVPSTQSNFPVLVSGTYDYLKQSPNGNVQSASGIDIKFTSDAAGNNLLAYEQEKYVATTGEIAYWVKLPSITDGTGFFIFYGNSSATDQSNKTAVWDSNYKAVLHLKETRSTASGNYKDSTANGNHGTLTDPGGSSAQTGGQIGDGINLTGVSETDYISLGNPASLQITGALTLSAWVRLGTLTGDGVHAIVSKWGGFELSLDDNPDNNLATFGGGAYASQSTQFSSGQWIYVTSTYEPSAAVRVYRNDTQVAATTSGVGASTTDSGRALVIGARGNATPNRPWNGKIDEVRISTTFRSADWIKTEFNNQSAPGVFYAIASGDTQAPTAPTNLTASAVSSSQINLTWTASTDNVGVTGYRVERCQGTNCSFAEIATVGAVTTYNNTTGLAAGTTYSYRVRATDAAGNLSGYSDVQTATTSSGSDTQPPSAPGTLTASAVSASQINLSWGAATDNVGVTGYSVERCQGTNCSFAEIATVGAVTTYNNTTGLAAGTTYSYHVRATDAAGNWGSYSNVASATTSSGSGYQFHRQITINSNQVPSTQPDFPVLVSGTYDYLKTTNYTGGKVQSATGIDIKFTSDAAGNNIVPYEQEKYVASTGEIAYWVKLSSISDGSIFYLFYGNSSATDQSNKTAVWDSNFKGVWHFGNGSTLSATDSTSNGNNGTVTAATATTGKVDGGANFNGTSAWVDVPNIAAISGASQITVETWGQRSSTGDFVLMLQGAQPSIVGMEIWSDGYFYAEPSSGSTGYGYYATNDTNFHHWVMVFDGSQTGNANRLKVYDNGVQQTLSFDGGTVGSTTGSSTGHLAIGRNRSGGLGYTRGVMDEVRVSNLARSAAWIQAEYNNHNSPSSFYSIGAEQ